MRMSFLVLGGADGGEGKDWTCRISERSLGPDIRMRNSLHFQCFLGGIIVKRIKKKGRKVREMLSEERGSDATTQNIRSTCKGEKGVEQR